MPVETSEPEDDPDVAGEIYAFDQYVAAGCDLLVAMALASADVSPSALRELVAHGCPLDEAIAILL